MESYSMFLGRKNQYCEMNILPNTIYSFKTFTIKLPMALFKELEIKFHNSYGNTKDLEAKAVLRKKNGAEGINVLDFR